MKELFCSDSGKSRDSPEQKDAVFSGRYDRKRSGKSFTGTIMVEGRKRL